MANIPPIQFRRTEVAGRVPADSDLAVGGIVLNLADGRIFSKNTSGQIVTVGGARDIITVDSESLLANFDSDYIKHKHSLVYSVKDRKFIGWDSDENTFVDGLIIPESSGAGILAVDSENVLYGMDSDSVKHREAFIFDLKTKRLLSWDSEEDKFYSIISDPAASNLLFFDSDGALLDHANADSDFYKVKNILYVIKNTSAIKAWDSDLDSFVELATSGTPEWSQGSSYTVGDQVYNDWGTFECIEDHTADSEQSSPSYSNTKWKNVGALVKLIDSDNNSPSPLYESQEWFSTTTGRTYTCMQIGGSFQWVEPNIIPDVLETSILPAPVSSAAEVNNIEAGNWVAISQDYTGDLPFRTGLVESTLPGGFTYQNSVGFYKIPISGALGYRTENISGVVDSNVTGWDDVFNTAGGTNLEWAVNNTTTGTLTYTMNKGIPVKWGFNSRVSESAYFSAATMTVTYDDATTENPTINIEAMTHPVQGSANSYAVYTSDDFNASHKEVNTIVINFSSPQGTGATNYAGGCGTKFEFWSSQKPGRSLWYKATDTNDPTVDLIGPY